MEITLEFIRIWWKIQNLTDGSWLLRSTDAERTSTYAKEKLRLPGYLFSGSPFRVTSGIRDITASRMRFDRYSTHSLSMSISSCATYQDRAIPDAYGLRENHTVVERLSICWASEWTNVEKKKSTRIEKGFHYSVQYYKRGELRHEHNPDRKWINEFSRPRGWLTNDPGRKRFGAILRLNSGKKSSLSPSYR